MQILVLASGSKGNCSLININGENFLIDAGINYKQYKERLLMANCFTNKINGIFLTHEHSDHCCGLAGLYKEFKCNIFLTQGTYENLKPAIKNKIPQTKFKIIHPMRSYNYNGFKIVTYPTSHDAGQPVGYIFENNEKKIVYMTDTGYVNEKLYELLKNASVYVLESNYDIELLMNSTRPWYLKQRIFGDSGHLSNEQSAGVLVNLIGEKTEKIVLAHLSEECNSKQIARQTIENILQANEINFDGSNIYVAHQHKVTDLIVIDGDDEVEYNSVMCREAQREVL